MSEDSEMDDTLNDIFNQLSSNAKNCTELKQPANDVHVHTEDIEQFAIDTSAQLVKKTLEIVEDIKDRACASSDPEDVQALASVLKAASSAMEAFNKIYISIERNKTVKEMKKADIESRTKMNITNNQTKLLMSREDVLKKLFDDAAEVEAEIDEQEVIDV